MAEPAAGGDRLTQAVNLEKKARELEAHGRDEEALREYKNALAVFEFVYKWEQNPRVKVMLGERLGELLTRAETLKSRLETVRSAPPAAPVARAGSDGVATQPPGTQESDEQDKEKEKLRKGLEGCILREKPDVKWDDVAGLQAAKESLQETVFLPIRFPQLFSGKRKPWAGILLYGPPGTGKSYLAKACATEAEATFFSLSSSDLVSKWMGESERLVKNLFEMARENKPAIIFIDEVDSLTGARGESGESDAARRIKTEFLAQMDGVGKDKSGLLVLGATNCPWDIDSAIRRRFEVRVYIPLPEVDARVTMLRLNLGDTPNNLTHDDMMVLAQRTEGFSGADMALLVKQALFEPIKRARRAKTFLRVTRRGKDGVDKQYWTACSPGHPQAVEMTLMDVKGDELLEPDVLLEDFEAALEKRKPSVSPGDLKRFEEWTALFGQDGAE